MTGRRSRELAFGTPDWSLDLDLDERIAGAPPDARVLGWVLNSVLTRAEERGVELDRHRRLNPFAGYPLEDYLKLLAEAATKLDPEQPARKNLYDLGLAVYPAFSESVIGRMVTSALKADREPRDALRWVARAYRLTSEHTRAQVVLNIEGRAIIHLANVWSFPDVYHVGIFAGAVHALTDEAIRVQVCPISLHECFIELRGDED